jgi:MOSC domain-containing protein YiiM
MNDTGDRWPIEALCAGKADMLPGGQESAIAKSPLEGSITIGSAGLEGDIQVDRVHHGYAAMAVHFYPHQHYDWLRQHFGLLPRLSGPGAMGENVSFTGLDEYGVHIGDRFRLGSAIVEISQPRQPCATIERHLEARGAVRAIVAAGRCGWFARVIEPGTAQAGDTLERVETGARAWSVARAFFSVYGRNRATDHELAELAALPRVSDRLVRDIARKMA